LEVIAPVFLPGEPVGLPANVYGGQPCASIAEMKSSRERSLGPLVVEPQRMPALQMSPLW